MYVTVSEHLGAHIKGFWFESQPEIVSIDISSSTRLMMPVEEAEQLYAELRRVLALRQVSLKLGPERPLEGLDDLEAVNRELSA